MILSDKQVKQFFQRDAGYAIRLTLSKPVNGPLTLGHGSHFGLGLFPAMDEP